MQWYQIRFTKEEMTAGDSTLLTDQFIKVCYSLGSPKGMALLSEEGAGDNTSSVYYLNTVGREYIRELTKIFSAIPCSLPTGKNLHLVFGDSNPAEKSLRTA